MIDCVKVQTHLFVFNWDTIGTFLALFLPLRSNLWSWGEVQKFFLEPTYVNNQLWSWKYSPIFLFLIQPHFRLFSSFYNKTSFLHFGIWKNRSRNSAHFSLIWGPKNLVKFGTQQSKIKLLLGSHCED